MSIIALGMKVIVPTCIIQGHCGSDLCAGPIEVYMLLYHTARDLSVRDFSTLILSTSADIKIFEKLVLLSDKLKKSTTSRSDFSGVKFPSF